jgi:hypothetical protein
VKLLAIVPDPASAYGLGALLNALPPGTTRVVAYGQATAAVLPPSLDVFVYPVRDGTRLPAPFIEALLEHEAADVLLAPTGSVASTPVPTLLVDLDPRVAPPVLMSGEDPASWTWVEGITALAERRPVLLRAGLFSVDVLADWFEGPGRLRASAGPALMARMTDLAGLLGRHREAERRAVPPASQRPPAGLEPQAFPSSSSRSDATHVSLEGSLGGFEAEKYLLTQVKRDSILPAANLGQSPSLRAPGPPSTPAPPRIVPIQVRSAADLGPDPGGAPAALAEPEPGPEPEPRPLLALTDLGPAAAPPVPTASHPPEAYFGRHAGGRALVLASVHGLDRLSRASLAEAAVVATPETLPWLATRMGVAQYVCLAAPPRTPEAVAALAEVRAVVVHDERLDAEELAPRAWATVPLLDLQRAGGPALGWSDDMKVGFFPAGGDAAVALQWAHWLGVTEVVLAGIDAADGKPGWSPFLRGARELLEARGITVTVLDPGVR